MIPKICIRLSLFIVVVLIMVQGCAAADYLTFHGDAQRTGYVADAGPLSENIRWSVSPGSIDSSPVVEGDRVYIATIADPNNPSITPAVFCYNTSTGAEVWTYETGSEAGLTLAGDNLIVAGKDGYLYALDKADGSLEWSVQADEHPGYFGLSSSPLYYGGLLYQLTPSDGGLHVYDPAADDKEVWSVAFGDWDVGWTNATYFTAPAAAGDKVYFPSNLSELYAYNITSKTKFWNTTLEGIIRSAPVIDTASLFITTTTTLYEVSLADGSITASQEIAGTPATPALNSTAHRLYVGTKTGLLWLNSEDITAGPVWTETTAKIDTSPVVAGDLIYAATNEAQSTLYAFSAADGSDAWSYTLPKAPFYDAAFFGSSPAVADGTLYIGAENTNTLFAFGPGAAYETTVVLQDGEKVVLTDGTLVNETTAAGALHLASTACGFTVDTSGKSWGSSLNLLGDMGWDGEHWWQQFENGGDSIGLDAIAHDGDIFSFWYSGEGDTLPTATTGVSNLVTVHVSVLSEDIGAFNIADTSVARGSSFLARLNVIKADAGWYVIDVSGVDSEGNSLSGLATVELAASTTKTGIPVHVQVPLNAPTGEYELFAAVYAFDNFPYTKPVTSEGITCTVL